MPGIGRIRALTIPYEIHDITRFDRVQEFASYARLIKDARESRDQRDERSRGRKVGLVPDGRYHTVMDLQLTALFRKVPEGNIGFVEELPE